MFREIHRCRPLAAAGLLIALTAASPALAQRGPRGGGGGGRPNAAKETKKSDIKPYDEVIPEDATTSKGLFITHRDGDSLYYELPLDTLGIDMLWVTQVAQTTAGASFAGMPVTDRVVRWEQRGERILLRDVRYNIRAETDDPIAGAVAATNLAPILKVFPVKAYGKDRAPVIDVTSLFTSDVDAISAADTLSAGGMDSKRTFFESVKAFPINLETKVLATYRKKSGGGAGGFGGFGGGGAPDGPITALIHHSMIKLPENPMAPRRFDDRVGFFTLRFTDYADDTQHEVEAVRYITRWRLEKKDPDAAVSDPVKPIVFYVGRGVPEKWKSYVKAGIDSWAPAFEAAGFSNAIRGEYAPDPRDDPDWDAEDARIASIRWLASDIPNAFGPHVHDPRTGEILEADVRIFQNVMKLARDWYFVQAGACDERAQSLPMPDELMGELLQFIVAHEVGHSLGLPHNMKASSAYSIAQLRDADWVKNNGTAPSIMDYARFNYVAQPGDGAGLIPNLGPYDFFSVDWGYRQFDADADEKAELETIVKKQIDEPMYRFGGGGEAMARSEDLSDDPIEATRLGLLNLHRVTGFLVTATSDEGEDYGLLQNMYDAMWGQWGLEMAHVAALVGGVETINLRYGDADQRFFPIDADRQRDAVSFLLENALSSPTDLTPDDIIGRLTSRGVAARVASSQGRVLGSLVSQRRIDGMNERAERSDGDAYSGAELLDDMTDGVFSELGGKSVVVDVYRRNVHRAYVTSLANALRSPSATSDFPGLARLQLTGIMEDLSEARGADDVTTAHLADLVARIERALSGDEPAAAGSAAPTRPTRRRGATDGCWGCTTLARHAEQERVEQESK